MTVASIIFCDTNTIWHQKIAEALNLLTPTLAIEPFAVPRTKPARSAKAASNLPTLTTPLPPGWASRTAALGQRLLAAKIRRAARGFPRPAALILTNPRYSVLARALARDFISVYYCADDYASYDGWGGAVALDAEAELLKHCAGAVFVSEALRARAIQRFGLNPERTLTSPNATEPRFFLEAAAATAPPDGRCLARPIVGILGALTPRLDLALVERIAGMPAVGTLLIAGPADDPSATTVASHRKVFAAGHLPHAKMHLWANCMDAALIPYAVSPINHFCSPLRLYDHLASGVPIFSTDACDQINRNDALVSLAPASTLANQIASRLPLLRDRPARTRDNREIALFWPDRARIIQGFLNNITRMETSGYVL